MFTSRILPVIAVAFALLIFAIDTEIPLGMAVAVLYVVVVLMAVSFTDRRGVLATSVACAVLTLSSYFISHGFTFAAESFARCVMSLSAIAITTVLGLRTQAASAALRERARLLDLTHDSVFVRDMRDVITFWNRGAEELYGWPRDEAVGQVSHRLT